MAYGNVRAFGNNFESIVRYNRTDFQDDMPFKIKAGHFKIYPDQKVILQIVLLRLGWRLFSLVVHYTSFSGLGKPRDKRGLGLKRY